jgi:hypothetical protein
MNMIQQILTLVALGAFASQPLGPVPGSEFATHAITSEGVMLEQIHLPGDGERDPGLSGSATVDGQQADVVFTYHTGRLWPEQLVPDMFYDGDHRPPVNVELQGYIEIPQTTQVKIWHAGGGVNGDTAELILGGRSLSIVGDDTVKNVTMTLTIPGGTYFVQWKHVTAGVYRPHYLKFENAETGEPIECFNLGFSIPDSQYSGPVALIDVSGDPAEWGIIGEPSYWTAIDFAAVPAPPPTVTTEHWQAKFANGIEQVYVLSSDGTATVSSSLWQDTGTIERGEGYLIIRFSQDRAERWTAVGEKMVIEHWFPASRLPTQAPVLGIAETRIVPVQEPYVAPGTERDFLFD